MEILIIIYSWIGHFSHVDFPVRKVLDYQRLNMWILTIETRDVQRGVSPITLWLCQQFAIENGQW